MTAYEFTTQPRPLTRHERYNASEKGLTRREKYESARPGRQRERDTKKYLSRPFVAWDGEGTDNPDGSHAYVLLANSVGAKITAPPPKGLATIDIFEFLLSESERIGDAIHVMYGSSYDINMMLSDLSRREIEWVKNLRTARIWDYRIQWRAGKVFRLADKTRSILIYDIVSFFQCSFVNACDGYLGTDWLDRDRIIREKANRQDFQYADIEQITIYNDAELVNMVRLADELRTRLDRAGLRIPRWDGPGAIAATLMGQKKIKRARNENLPEPVSEAGRFAYFGGRFERVYWGHCTNAFQYDINSAYPSALRHVPNLAQGTWERVSKYIPGNHYGVYRIKFNNIHPDHGYPQLYPIREPKGMVNYPSGGEGWYWTPEVDLGMKLYPDSIEIIDGWIFRPDTSEMPFDFIDGLYLKRAALKKGGDGAHVGIKLALNSLYGKLAQQVGWFVDDKGRVRIPPYHQIEWAGFVTSYTRAQLYSAAASKPESVIAYETDAVFTSEPLDIPTSNKLGEWEETKWDDLLYYQSGFYFGHQSGGKVVEKTRGIDRGHVTYDRAMQAFHDREWEIKAPLTRFYGAALALHQNFDKWRRWEVMEKTVNIGPMISKRIHPACSDACRGDLHATLPGCTIAHAPHMSTIYPVEWINPDPNMIVNEDGITFQEAREMGESWDE